MNDIVIAIRTSNRINTIEEHTLKVIKDLPYKVYIFCPQYEKKEYIKKYKGVYTITDGGDKGAHLCNQKIVDYFCGNKKIIQLDDDIKSFLEWNGEKFIDGDLQHYIEEGFRLLKENNFKLFGFDYINDSSEIRKGLQLCVGGIHGFINDKSLRTIDNHRDDYERSILNYIKYGGCITFNKCKVDIEKSINKSTEYMTTTYPNYCRIKCESPYPEIEIKNIPYKTEYHLEKQLNLITWSKNTDRPNVSGKDEVKSKKTAPVGLPCYSYTFGYIRPRRTKIGTRELTRITSKYPIIHTLASKYIYEMMPDFSFSTITINKDIVCLPHTDRYNQSDSLIVAFGDYTEGGNLYIKINDIEHKIDIKNKPYIFNGRNLHWNDKPNNSRYSLVYFNL